MSQSDKRISRLLKTLDAAWTEFHASYAGLRDEQLLEPGVIDDWSVRDVIAHVSWWEEEALKHMPLILDGGQPARYSVTYGGIDAFNALKAQEWRDLSLADVRQRADETHRRLVAYIESLPTEQLIGDSRLRRRLRLDTYGHYPLHTRAIREWRACLR